MIITQHTQTTVYYHSYILSESYTFRGHTLQKHYTWQRIIFPVAASLWPHRAKGTVAIETMVSSPTLPCIRRSSTKGWNTRTLFESLECYTSVTVAPVV